MKKNNLFSIVLLFVVSSLTAQIDIVSSELTIQGGTEIRTTTGQGGTYTTAPTHGDFQYWDYTNQTFTAPSLSETFVAGTNPAFPTANLYTNSGLFLGAFAVPAKIYYEKSNQLFAEVGREIENTRIGLALLTGNPNDSLIVASYSGAYSQPLVEYDFPVTANKTWSSTAVTSLPFELKLPSFFIPYAPGAVVSTITRTDSIVGWGMLKMLAPHNNTDTLNIQVLLSKSTFHQIDSVFLAGAPASPMLLTAFNLVQGRETEYTDYLFLAKNMAQPAFTLLGGDSLYFPISADIIPEAAIDLSNTKPAIQTVNDWSLYPNPVVDGKFSIAFEKPTDETCFFSLYNTLGQQVFTRAIDAPKGDFQQDFELNTLPKGNYFYALQSANGKTLVGGTMFLQ